MWQQEDGDFGCKEGKRRLVPAGALCSGQRSFAPRSLLPQLSVSELSLCSDSYTLEHASAFEGFWKSCARLERDGSSSGQMEGDHASSVLARFLSIGINNLLTTVYKRVALAQGWNKGSVM